MTVHARYAGAQNGNGNGSGPGKFSPGPVAETIAYSHSEQVPSNYTPGWQMKYQLVDGRTWYATHTTLAKIENLGIRAGDPFRVCRRDLGGGQSVIDVHRVAAAQIPPTEPSRIAPSPAQQAAATSVANPNTAPTEPMSQLEKQLRGSLALLRSDKVEPAAAAPAPQPAPAALMTGQAQFYLERAVELIDLVAASHKYAIEMYNGTFSKEDVRALVTTVYIQHTAKPFGGNR